MGRQVTQSFDASKPEPTNQYWPKWTLEQVFSLHLPRIRPTRPRQDHVSLNVKVKLFAHQFSSMIQHLLGLVRLLLRFPQPKSRKTKSIENLLPMHWRPWLLLAMAAVGKILRPTFVGQPQFSRRSRVARCWRPETYVETEKGHEGGKFWRTFCWIWGFFCRNMATDKDNKVYSCLPFLKACVSLNMKRVVLTCDSFTVVCKCFYLSYLFLLI